MSFLVTNTEYDAIVEKDADTGERIPSVREVWDEEKRIWKRFVIKFDVSVKDSSDSTIEEYKK